MLIVYYNEHDPFTAKWLEKLAMNGHIEDGCIDRRDMQQVTAADVAGFTRVHWFAGIGGWDLALRMAGWPDDVPVWTGSCPCQPFSRAGKGKGTEDERHLWPVFRDRIEQCRPAIIFGEQVARAAGRQWLAAVRADLEALGYAVGAADLCAAGVGAPHIRQRLYWVAYSQRGEWKGGGVGSAPKVPGELAAHGGLGNADIAGLAGRRELGQRPDQRVAWTPGNPWRGAVYHPFRDDKARPLEPGLEPVAHGVSNRVGRLRGYGNAIVPQVAATFIRAVMDVVGVNPC